LKVSFAPTASMAPADPILLASGREPPEEGTAERGVSRRRIRPDRSLRRRPLRRVPCAYGRPRAGDEPIANVDAYRLCELRMHREAPCRSRRGRAFGGSAARGRGHTSTDSSPCASPAVMLSRGRVLCGEHHVSDSHRQRLSARRSAPVHLKARRGRATPIPGPTVHHLQRARLRRAKFATRPVRRGTGRLGRVPRAPRPRRDDRSCCAAGARVRGALVACRLLRYRRDLTGAGGPRLATNYEA
jgi:hypothetical protein